MKTKLTLIAFLVGLLLAGCASADKLNALHIGMPKDEVISILGQPDSKSAQGNIEYFTYYLANEGGSRDQPYLVRLVDGKVESFGRFAQLSDIYNRPINGQQAPYAYGATAPMGVAPVSDLADQLQKLKALKDQGALTDEEFQRAKNRLIGGQN